MAAGRALLAQARDAAPTRETALTLLAADALVTYSCQAAAEPAQPPSRPSAHD